MGFNMKLADIYVLLIFEFESMTELAIDELQKT